MVLLLVFPYDRNLPTINMLNSVNLHHYLATDPNTTKLSRNKDLSENRLLIYHFRVKYHGRNELNSKKNSINHKIYN